MSIEINLLPWREQRREQRRRHFYLALAGMALLGVAGGLGVTWHYAAAMQSQQQRNAHIVEQAHQLEGKIHSFTELVARRDQWLGQWQHFDALQQSRSQTMDILRGLTESLVDGVHYVQLSRRGDQLSLAGRAQNSHQVAEQLRALATMPVFFEPVLTEVEAEAEEPHRFRLGMTLRGAPQEDQPGGTEGGS